MSGTAIQFYIKYKVRDTPLPPTGLELYQLGVHTRAKGMRTEQNIEGKEIRKYPMKDFYE